MGLDDPTYEPVLRTLHSIRAVPLPPVQSVLESDIQSHARTAVRMLRD